MTRLYDAYADLNAALESLYDGGEDGRPHVEPGSVGGLLCQVMAKRGG